jgi:hypothetical protein
MADHSQEEKDRFFIQTLEAWRISPYTFAGFGSFFHPLILLAAVDGFRLTELRFCSRTSLTG